MDGPAQPPAPNGNAANGNAANGSAAIDTHQPFTPAERIQQLADIDQDIASLLTHLSSAIRALATPPTDLAPPAPDPAPAADPAPTPRNGHTTAAKQSSSSSSGYDSSDPVVLLQPPDSSTSSSGTLPAAPLPNIPRSEPADPSSSSTSSGPHPAAAPTSNPTDPANPITATQVIDPITAFRTAQTSFFRAIDRIDKNLTRQILALEEAGIVTLRNRSDKGAAAAAVGGGATGEARPQQPGFGGAQGLRMGGPGGGALGGIIGEGQGGKVVVARLEPDGMGRYGGLDVGKLNMASSTVERDMEGELWKRAREQLGEVVGAEVKREEDGMEE